MRYACGPSSAHIADIDTVTSKAEEEAVSDHKNIIKAKANEAIARGKRRRDKNAKPGQKRNRSNWRSRRRRVVRR